MLSQTWLYENYVNKKIPMQKLAKMSGVSYSTINRWIKLHNIKPRTNGEHKKVDITGQIFGSWTAIKEVVSSTTGPSKWSCKCKCGTERTIEANALCSSQRTRCCKCFGISIRTKGKLTKDFWGQIKKSARKRNISIEVGPESIYQLLQKQKNICALSGLTIQIAPTIQEHWNGGTTASLDRIDSSKNYEIRNVHWVHKHINIMKRAMHINTFVKICKDISNFSNLDIKPLQEYQNKISNTFWNKIRRSAIKRNLKFDIRKEQAWEIFLNQGGRCAISGCYIDFSKSTYTFQKFNDGTASLDRIDSAIGYIEGNIQWLHKKVNNMKSNHSQKYFIELCSKVAEFNQEQIELPNKLSMLNFSI